VPKPSEPSASVRQFAPRVVQLVAPRIALKVVPRVVGAAGSPTFRAYRRFKVQRGSRLAAAMAYSAFLSLFPLLAVSIAITAAVLGDSGVQRLRAQFQANLPGLADKFSLDSMVSQAATVGLISGVLLIWSGLSWVNTARGSLREIWKVPDMPGGFVGRKLADLASLAGLGLTAAVSIAATAASASLAATVLRWLGVADSWPARDLLRLLGVVVGLAASTAMFGYLLSGISRLVIARRLLFRAGLVAAAALEVTKGLVASYLSGVAGKSLYGAFGVPVAVMIWLDLTFQMLLFLSAWTAAKTQDAIEHAARVGIQATGNGSMEEQSAG
jgi:membrane protein